MQEPAEICQVECFQDSSVGALRLELPSTEVLEDLEVVFSVLGDRTRLKILHAMQEGKELCVCDLALLLNSSTAAVSHHLRKMKDVGILKNRSEGKLVYYGVRDRRVEEILKLALKGT